MKRFVAWICALMLMIGCIGDLTPVARAAEAAAPGPRAAGGVTYYVSASGKGGNNGLSENKPLPGLDAVPWDQLMPGDSVLLKKGDKFPGSIRVVDVHGTEEAPITIGAYGTASAAPVIEARGQGVWLPEKGNTDSGATPGKYASAGVLLYDCSYVTVSGLEIVNRPDALKTSFIDYSADRDGVSDHTSVKMPCAGVAVAADGGAAAPGIVLESITVRGDSDVQTVMTDTSTSIDMTSVTEGAEAPARTYTDAAGTYYVSSLNGSDSNDGSSPDKAFYSLHKINELNLKPGVKVYLERGSVFENQYLHIEGGGADGNPAIIDSYGSGDAPVINTNGNGVWYQNFRKNLDNSGHLRQGYVSSSILIYDVEYIEIRNIAMTNFGRYGETPGADFENLHSYDGGTVPGETGYNGTGQNGEGNKIGCYQWGGKMARTGVAGVSQNVGTMDHVYLQNLDIENVYGNVMYKHMDNGGIYFTIAYALKETGDGGTGIPKIDDLRIEGCYLKRVSRWGIAAAYTGAYSGLFGGSAISDETCQTYGVTNLYIGHNYIEEVGGDPITTMYAYEPVVEYNVALNGGREMSGVAGRARYINSDVFAGNTGDVSAGIWPWKCKTALFEHNECYNMLYGRINGGIGNNDAQAWDADYGDSTIYQYNYSSGNTGGCVMFCYTEAYNTVFRYNISYKDGMPGNDRGVLDMSSNANGQVMNNTFIMAENTRVHRGGHSGPAQVENNIFYNLGSAYDPSWTANGGLTYNTNIYSGFSGSPSTDSHAITVAKDALFADTAFTGAPTAPKSTSKDAPTGTVNGIRDWTHDWATEFDMFKLKDTNNAAINAGVPYSYTGLTQDANFGVPRVPNDKDFYGSTLDEVHDIGAHDTLTAGGEAPASAPTLVSSLYEIRGTNNMQVPLGTNLSPTVETFLKGLTVSEGAAAKVYQSDGTTEVTSGSIAAEMKVKIVAGDGTVSDTVYTIKSKTLYNSQSDWVDNQQGNVWFYQAENNGVFTNQTSMGTTYKDWTGGGGAVEQNQAVGDINNSKGAGFTFRAPVSGKVTVTFNYKAADDNAGKASAAGVVTGSIRKRASTPNSKWQTWLRTYRNDTEIADKAIMIPMDSITPIPVESYTITVAQGDTLSFMIRNETKDTTNTSNGGNHGVYYNPVITYVDEAFTEPADQKAPTAPSGVRATNITENSATISWTASTDNVGVSHYVVTEGTNTMLVTDLTDLTATLTGLTPNTEYTVKVKAIDAAGNESAESSVTFRTARTPDTTPPTPPTVPTGGAVVDATQTTADIAWNASTDNVGVDHYVVTVNGGAEIIVRNATQMTLTGLTPDTSYEVTVKAVDAAGNKSGALAFNFKTLQADNTAPAAPTGLMVLDTTKSTAILRWTLSADEDVVGYQIQVDNDEPQDVGNVFQYTLTGLAASTGYTVKVRAVDESGNFSDWATADFETVGGSSEMELLASLYEIRDTSKFQVPFTENNPMTVERFRTGLEVSEDATVKVFASDGHELSATDEIGDGMTVKIVAQDRTENPTTYTIVQKNTYNSYVDWINQQQGNVWFYQHETGTEIVNHTLWNSWGWGGEGPAYKSTEQNQACGSVTEEQGSGYTFRAPADGMVQIRFYYYLDKNSDAHVEDQVKKRENTSSNTLIPYIGIFINGQKLDSKDILLAKDGSAVTVEPMTFSVKQGELLSFLACNRGDFSNKSGNNGVYFTPVLTYLDEAYVPDPTGVTMSQTSATIYTNTINTAELQHTVKLSAAVQPDGANQTVTWSSNNENVATVDQTGLVTAVGKGTATIRATATASTGETVWASCAVTVSTRIESITVEKDGTTVSGPIRIYANENSAGHPNSVTLTARPTPADPSHPALSWTDPEDSRDIISIEQSGENGTSATITASVGELDVGRVIVRVASAHHPEVYTNVAIDVFRFLEHDVYVVGDAKLGSTLAASIVELGMTEEATAALQYQWYRDSVSEENRIAGATDGWYVVTTDDIGHKLVVTVTADETTFYEGTRTAESGTVGLAAGPAAPIVGTVDCTAAGNDGKITGLDPDKIYEFKLADADDNAWEQVAELSEEILGLTPGNYLVRIAATDTAEAGAAATATILSAEAAATAHSITISSSVEHGTIVPSVTKAQPGDKFTLTVTSETGYKLAGSLSVTYTNGDGTHTLAADADGKYTMPGADVTVTASFVKLTFTISHADMENMTCNLPGDHPHTVEYGDSPVVTFTADEGYTMPASMRVTYVDENGVEQTFYNYTYSRSAANPDTATLRFTSGITTDLIITAVIPAKIFTVSYTLTNGLTAPAGNGNNARTVGYKEAYMGQLEAEDDSRYTLPLGIEIKMGGEPFAGFAYDSSSGVFTIGAGEITGDLTIIASGVDASKPVNPVDNMTLSPRSASVAIGGTVTLTATVIGADPSIPATNSTVIWTSSNPDIATVDNGVVTGVARGTVTIRATTVDGGIFRTCQVTVSETGSGGSSSFIPSVSDTGTSTSTTTTTTTNPDGSTTTTVTDNKTGIVTETTTDLEGGKVEKVTTSEKDVTVTVTDAEGEVLAKVELPNQIPAPETRFADVPEGHWADEAIHNMAALEVVNGVGGDRYNMNGNMTRGALATVLRRMSNGQEGLKANFTDVDSDEWYADGIAWAARVGVVTGRSADTFAPEATITREELAVMLCRYARLLGMDTTADSAALDSFNDGSSTHNWAADSLAWCVDKGILKGMGNDTLAPTATATRAQVAVMLQRFIDLMK